MDTAPLTPASDGLPPLVSHLLCPEAYPHQQQFLAEHRALLRRRVDEGRVCEGHGDLRAEHICLDTDLNIFDCIEFNPGLRYCDVASEVAFLRMDLDFLGAPDLAAEFVDAYTAAQTPDAAFSILLPFYQSYRAYVRGKVESLTGQEDAVPAAQRSQASLQARRYFCLATRYALGAPPPTVLVVCDLSGSGKSTLAALLAQRTGFRLLNSDTVRKTLAGIPPNYPSRREEKKYIYFSRYPAHLPDATGRSGKPYRSGLRCDYRRYLHRASPAPAVSRLSDARSTALALC